MTNDYIRREDALDAFNRAVQDVGILDADDIETVFGMLSYADVAPVVRCKDCKFRKPDNWFCYNWQSITGDNSFCNFGKRREE